MGEPETTDQRDSAAADGDTRAVASRTLNARHQAALVALVFVMSLIPRLWSPSPFITWDEPTWTFRSMQFADALRTGHLADTRQSSHPGVPTMWVGAAGMMLRDIVRASQLGQSTLWYDIEQTSLVDEFDEDDTRVLFILADWWPWARGGIAVLTAALVTLTFFLLMRLTDRRTALVAAALLSFGPYFLAHSRVLQLDAVMAAGMVASVVSLVVALVAVVVADGRRRSTRYAALAGALAGFAALEKSPALFLLPFAVLVIVAFRLHAVRACKNESVTRPALVTLAVWLAAAVAAYIVLWPAMWVAPLQTLGAMWGYATSSAGGAREAVFFWGAVQPDPGVRFYLGALPFRITPLVIGGLLGALIAFKRESLGERSLVIALLAFATLFTFFMGESAKKFERYILPVLPALSIVAGVGLVRTADAVSRQWQGLAERRGRTISDAALRRSANVVLVLALALQYASVFRHHPYYLAWYNPLLGGARVASQRLPVGWGEGMDLAADYLNLVDVFGPDPEILGSGAVTPGYHARLVEPARAIWSDVVAAGRSAPDAGDLVVSTPSVALLAPFFHGETVTARHWRDADYVVLYVDDVQIGEPELVRQFHGVAEPERVVTVNGIDYAWIYRVADMAAP